MADHQHMDLKSREYFNRRLGAMETDLHQFTPHYQDLSDFVRPRRGKFFLGTKPQGAERYKAIINSHATQALRTATAGMFAGTMSPARPWFRLIVADPDLMERPEIKQWLEIVEKIVRAIFNQGNLYSMAPSMLSELLLFSTGCMLHVDDFQDVARFYTQTIGTYMIGQDDRGVVNTLIRQFERTTAQIVAQFGLETISPQVKTAWDRSNYDQKFPIVNFIEVNPEAIDGGIFGIQKPFRSVHYEKGGNDKAFLGFAGFEEFPAYCPRWETTGEEVYGTDCPGMTALGDIRGLQTEEKRKAQGIDKLVNPPLHGPASLETGPTSSLPGSLTTYDAQGTHVLRSIYDINLRLGELMADIEKVEHRIDDAFFVPLFNAISSMQGIQPRNEEEIALRHGESLLQLGPVLQRVHGDFLALMVDRTFNQAARAGILPEAPEELQDRKVDVRFISTLAQAQRAVATNDIERVAAFAGSLADVWPNAAKKFDALQAVDEFSDAIGAPAKIVKSDDVVADEMAKEQEQLELQQAQEAMKDLLPGAAQVATAATGANAQALEEEGA